MKPEILHEDKTDESEKKRHIRPLHGKNAIWKVFVLFFPSFTLQIQAKINELESESNIFALNERQSWPIWIAPV